MGTPPPILSPTPISVKPLARTSERALAIMELASWDDEDPYALAKVLGTPLEPFNLYQELKIIIAAFNKEHGENPIFVVSNAVYLELLKLNVFISPHKYSIWKDTVKNERGMIDGCRVVVDAHEENITLVKESSMEKHTPNLDKQIKLLQIQKQCREGMPPRPDAMACETIIR